LKFNHLECTLLPYKLEKQINLVLPSAAPVSPAISWLEAASSERRPERIVELTVTGHGRLIFRGHEPTNTASDIDVIDHRQGDCNAHEI